MGIYFDHSMFDHSVIRSAWLRSRRASSSRRQLVVALLPIQASLSHLHRCISRSIVKNRSSASRGNLHLLKAWWPRGTAKQRSPLLHNVRTERFHPPRTTSNQQTNILLSTSGLFGSTTPAASSSKILGVPVYDQSTLLTQWKTSGGMDLWTPAKSWVTSRRRQCRNESYLMCSLYNNIKPPSWVSSGADFHLFKKGIEPKWEDPRCEHGGKWTVPVPKGPNTKQTMDTYWLNAVCCPNPVCMCSYS